MPQSRSLVTPRMRAPLTVDRAFVLGLGLAVLGLGLVLTEPFGQPPVGPTSGLPGSMLNGIPLATAPPLAILLAYWGALAVPVRRYGVSDGTYLAGGRARTAPFFALATLMPLALYSRGHIVAGILASLAASVAVVGYLEIQRRLRPPIDSPRGLPHNAWVIQWDMLWIACVAATLAIWVATRGELDLATASAVVSVVVAIGAIAGPTAYELARARRALGYGILLWLVWAVFVGALAAPTTFAIAIAITALPALGLTERARRAQRAP